MQTVYFLVGPPASGKSTWSYNNLTYKNTVRINKDLLRSMLLCNKFRVEEDIIKARDSLLRLFLAEGKSVIIDDTNLNSIHKTRVKEIIEEHNENCELNKRVQLVTLYFCKPLNVLLQRNSLRVGNEQVPKEVVISMYESFTKTYGDKHLVK